VIGALVSGVGGVAATAGGLSSQALPAGGTETTPFSGVFQSLVGQTSALDAKASDSVTGLLNGQGVDIHDAMIATQKADMAFELALQVRNKAIGAYQQMMSMQF
jgi:flagellar hook-basal body complex protein FliE